MQTTTKVQPKQIMVKLNTLPGCEAYPDEVEVIGYDSPWPNTPKKGKHLFRPEIVGAIFDWLSYDERGGFMLQGPAGSGKSSELRQLAAHLNMPLFTDIGHLDKEVFEFFGKPSIVKGTTYYEYGPLTQAAMQGAWFLLEEMDRSRASVNIAFNSILDGYPIVLSDNEGEMIVPRGDFAFFATCNSNGNGARMDTYATVQPLDWSTLERFESHFIDYINEEDEINILVAKNPNVPRNIVARSVQIANKVRTLFNDSEATCEGINGSLIDNEISTRTLNTFLRKLSTFSARTDEEPVVLAMNVAYGNKVSPACRNAVNNLTKLTFGLSEND
jgi:cobaltochelatase CobS